MHKLAVVLTALTFPLVLASPAQAAGSVHLAKIYYDSPGTDTGSNSSLNAEWVTITNSTSTARSLKGWTLTDASSHKYTFGTFTLGAGKTVKVHTGSGDDTGSARYQKSSTYIWNNTTDKATLKKSTGIVVDTCAYSSSRVDYKVC